MKLFTTLFLFAETLSFSLRLWWWQKFGKAESVKKAQSNKIFYHKGRPTRYLHTIVFTKPDYVNRRLVHDSWHYYRQFKGHWITIKSPFKLN